MNSKKILIILILIVVVIGTTALLRKPSASGEPSSPTTETTVKFVSSTITADGTVTAQDQAKLSFQTGGKLTFLPFKEGAKVYRGQTIASLDTYVLTKALQLASNVYQMSKNGSDQTSEYNKAGILEGQTRYALDVSNKQGYSAITEDTVIYDTVQRIVNNDLLANNTAQIAVDLANYAIQLSSLTSPLNGIITHEDVTVAGVNVTTSTSFTVADPSTMVFRANVPTENIYYIAEGSAVTLAIDGIPQKLNGTVVKIYPSKIVLTNGQSAYPVDIASDDLKKTAKLDENGTAIIATNAKNVALIPAWTVLSGKYVWVDTNGTPELKTVTAGKVHGNEIEILGGLTPSDKIIIDPKVIPSRSYPLL